MADLFLEGQMKLILPKLPGTFSGHCKQPANTLNQ